MKVECTVCCHVIVKIPGHYKHSLGKRVAYFSGYITGLPKLPGVTRLFASLHALT